MSQYNIRRAFEKEATTVSGIASSYEGISFKPIVNTPYQSLILYPRNPENPTYGDNYHREVGFFQILLCYPNNKGTKDVSLKAEEIKSHFFRGMTLSEDDTEVIIRRTPSIGAGFVDSDRYCIPIRIEYFSNQC